MDGLRDGTRDNQRVENEVVHFPVNFEKRTGEKRDLLGNIEFVQLGNDSDVAYRLRRLNRSLIFQGVPDIVDSAPADGDVVKMLLDSLVEE
ncbi:hypothetical protein MMC25_001727 [Agyrium rufum]|nr:hypothetical protein [Agyrium rufum]